MLRPPWNQAMVEFFGFISLLLTLYIYVLVAAAVMSWLVAFNVVNSRNQFVAMVGDFLYRVTEPVLRPIRNVMPNLGGLDISPIIVIVIIWFIQLVIIPVLVRALI
jgi:YggT family protein